MRQGVLPDLVLTNREGLVGDMKAGGILVCSHHEIVEFRVLYGGSKATSRIAALDRWFCLKMRTNFFTLGVTEHWHRLPREAVGSPAL